ncbi:tenascin-R [Elysia marginata]|uniref:Tenascin-R n=1 Tax=Elysia marginata TaxID=1093978 RepID=A0AAV4ELT8_9GAST|nr:tenascin-R [Elysia marginata]
METCKPSALARLLLLVFIVANCEGLELSLTRSKSDLPGLSSSCGLLLCKERSLGSTDTDSPRRITNMTVFKTVSTGLGSSEHTRLIRLASLSPTQPNLDQVYDGMKLRGLLKDEQASLSIELSKQTDCLAEYICELKEFNSQGDRMVTSQRLVQQPDQSISSMQDTSLTSAVLMKLFSLIQEQNVKLEVITNNVERLENSFRGIEDKVCQLDSKLSVIDSNAIQEKVLTTIKTQIDGHFSKVLNSSEKTDNTLNRTATLLISLNSQNTNFQSNIMESYLDLFANVTRGMDELFVRNKNLTDKLENNFISFRDNVDLSWQRFESSTNKSSVKTLSALESVVLELNSTLVNNMESVLSRSLMLESCEKNRPVMVHPASTPYPVIYKSDIVGLNTPILCDTETDEGGWIIIQRRSTGAIEFQRNWLSYKNGFGNIYSDFWLGNENIHTITQSGKYELRVEVKYGGKSAYAVYDKFSLAGEDKNYAITLGAYSGSAGDALVYHNGQPFSTFDKDNDKSSGNCAQSWLGAWWYTNCHHSNLNGKWGRSGSKGLAWNTFTRTNSATFSEMKVRLVRG